MALGFENKAQEVANYTDYSANMWRNLTTKPLRTVITIFWFPSLNLKMFFQILDEYVGNRLVHYASIDIDGYEFPLLRELEDDGQYHQDFIVMCQVAIWCMATGALGFNNSIQFRSMSKYTLMRRLVNLHRRKVHSSLMHLCADFSTTPAHIYQFTPLNTTTRGRWRWLW